MCHKHCGCASRRRRSDAISPFGFLIIDENESDDIQTIEFLAVAMIEVEEDFEPIRRRLDNQSNEMSVYENSSRLRRSADLVNLNQLYSSVTERLDEIDDLFEGRVLELHSCGPYHMVHIIWTIKYDVFDMKIFKLCEDGQSAINSLVTKRQNIISRLKPLEVEFGQCTCRSGINFYTHLLTNH